MFVKIFVIQSKFNKVLHTNYTKKYLSLIVKKYIAKLNDSGYLVKADNKINITPKIINSVVSKVNFVPLYCFTNEGTEGISVDTSHTIQQELFAYQPLTFIPISEADLDFNTHS